MTARAALTLLGAGLAVLTMPVPGAAQSAQAPPAGGFFELEDYDYFSQPQPDPITPAFPQPAPAPHPGPAPVPAPVPTSSLTPTPAPSPFAPPLPSGGGAGGVPVAPYAPGGPAAFPIGDVKTAKADGKAFVTGVRSANRQIATTTDLAGTIPGFSDAALPEEALADDPDALTAQGLSRALSNDSWRVVTNPDRTVVALDPDAILRAQAVEADPDAYLEGSSLGAASGQCQPLPPSGLGTAYYEATCEEGAQPFEDARTCRAALRIETEGSRSWEYLCSTTGFGAGREVCDEIAGHPAGGTCTLSRSDQIGVTCLQWADSRSGRFCAEPGEPIYRQIWQCPGPLEGVVGGREPNTVRIVSENIDQSQCESTVAGASCTQSAEVCTGQPETRLINGLAVTRPCWEWERTYQCSGTAQATDCGDIAGNPQCTFLRDECLDDPQAGACQVATKVYRCPIPGGGTIDPAQYICGDDVYCIDGECEPIEREASTEFKDALVGLHALGQANAEFSEADLTLFSGTRETCTKKVFGIANCCSGKGVPLLTPFLCPAAERELDRKDDAGLCHRVGAYCSDRVLGVCVTRKDAYCCFESKLSRILQQQGRAQVNKRWDEPKRETCKGFTLDEFSLLDLSVMDFSEVYADFAAAAKLPDELETTQQIQQRIEGYLQHHGPS